MAPRLSDLYVAFDSAPTQIVAFLQGLVERYRLARPPRVLDVGCGPGRLLRPLAQLHWEVTAMEPNADFLASARAAAKESRRIRIEPGGFQDIDSVEAFDLVLGVNSSFAHLSRAGERSDALHRIHRALRPGGIVFLDLPNFLWILKHDRPRQPFSSTVQGREVTLHREHEIDYHEATFTTTDRYVYADGASPPVELVHAYGMTTLEELRFLLSDAGFAGIQTYNGYESAEPERLTGARMLVVAQRLSV